MQVPLAVGSSQPTNLSPYERPYVVFSHNQVSAGHSSALGRVWACRRTQWPSSPGLPDVVDGLALSHSRLALPIPASYTQATASKLQVIVRIYWPRMRL